MPTARLPIDAAHRAASSDAHAIGAVTGLTDALAAGRSEVLSSVTVLSTDHPATWTADAATDVLTSSAAHGLAVNTPIAFGAGTGVLPAGLSPEPEYYWVVAVPTTTTLQVSLTYGGAAVDITDAGTTGWVVKIQIAGGSTWGGLNATGFSLNTDKHIDIYYDIRLARGSTSSSIAWQRGPSAGDVVYDSAGWWIGSAGYFDTTALTKKYNRGLVLIRLNVIADGVAAFESSLDVRQADAPDFDTGRSGVSVKRGGIFTFTSDVTNLRVYDINAYGRILHGSTAIVVRRP